jgi:predicted ATP-dependent endonuclease of OLD family
MRIIRLTTENIKRIKALDITPGKFINRISGGNDEGKTSALDSILWCLTGTAKVPSQPVRKGAGKGKIEIDLGDIVVTRRFYEGGNRNGTLAIESKTNRTRYQSPQALLDSFMGRVSFDPLEFLRMKPEKQSEVLRSLVKLDVDVDALDAAHEAAYLRRREAKKDRDSLEIRRNAFGVPPGLPKEKVDETALVQELREASTYNDDIQRQQRQRNEDKGHREGLENDISENRRMIAELQEKIAQLEDEARQWTEKLEEVDADIAAWEPLPPLKDAAQLAAKITEARTINAGIDRRQQRDSYDDEINQLDKEIEALNATMEESENAKARAMSEAEFPIPGLAFGDNEVIYEGFSFNQASNAAQIRASVAIGMASNPELRVMLIKDGSLLDTKSVNMIAEMAQEQDFQVFMEVVDTSGKVGIYIEDGEVVRVNPEPEPKPTTKAKRKPKQALAAV